MFKVRPRPAKTEANLGVSGYKVFKVRPKKPKDVPKHGQRTVLNEANHDPAQQLDLDVLIVRIIVLAQLLMEKRFYPYQVALARRIIESLLKHDGDVITSLMSRQAGKTETIGGISGALSLVLPMLAKQFPNDWRLNITDDQGNYRGFATGLAIGIYAPKQEQSEITFNRVKKAFETKNGVRILREMKVTIEENNGNTLAFSNGSKVLCQSASKQSEIEGATHHMLIAEEAQDIDDLKMRKSLHPMVASTMGTIVKIGTASVRKCDFYNAIQNNRREELLTKRRNHFFFPWTVCSKYNSLYLRYIEGEKKKIGEHSDEFRMAYCGEWIFERGMFVTQDVLFSPQVAHSTGVWSQFYNNGYSGPSILRHFSWVAGIDWGRSSDSTVVCLMAVDWVNPLDTGESSDSSGTHTFAFYKKHIVGFWEFHGDNYEYQYGEIASRLGGIHNLKKIVMDSNSCGAPMFDRFAATFGAQGIEVTPFNFQPKVKSDGYKSFGADLWAGRITFPAGAAVRGTMEFRKFVQQMLDLKKDWKNGIMQVAHPEERGAHDDYCFPAGSPVVTSIGCVAIEEVKPGMLVLTSKGWRKVTVAFCSGYRTVIRRGNLVGTPNHPVFCVNRGMYVRLDSLMLDDIVLECTLEQQKSVSLMASDLHGTCALNEDIYVNTFGRIQNGSKVPSHYIHTFTKNITDVFQKVGSFITKTVTRAITVVETCVSVLVQNTSPVMQVNGLEGKRQESQLNWRNRLLEILDGTDRMSALQPLNKERKSFGKVEKLANTGAQNANNTIQREALEFPLLVQRNVRDIGGDEKILKNFESMPNAVVPVYNLTVAEVNEYVCQGVLVHNCDAAMLAAWGCNTPAIGGRVEFSSTNPFV